MTQAQTLTDIAARLTFIQQQLCLENAYVKISQFNFYDSNEEIILDAAIEIYLQTDSNDTIDAFLQLAIDNLNGMHGIFLAKLQEYYLLAVPQEFPTVKKFYESTEAKIQEISGLKAVMQSARIKLSEVENYFQSYLSHLISSYIGDIPNSFTFIDDLIGIESGLYEIPAKARFMTLNITAPIEGLYSSRVSLATPNRYLFGGVSFWLNGFYLNEIDIQWKAQIIKIPSSNPSQVSIFLKQYLTAYCAFYG